MATLEIQIRLSDPPLEFKDLVLINSEGQPDVLARFGQLLHQTAPYWPDLADDEVYPQRLERLQGRLTMLNVYGEGPYLCGLHLEEDRYLQGYVEDELAQSLKSYLGHSIVAMGIVTLALDQTTWLRFDLKAFLPLTPGPSEAELAQAWADYRADNDTLAHFRQAWRDMKAGEVHPMTDLWEGIDAE
jgi:hypothetical protein